MAFVYGRIGDGQNILARLHRADVIAEVFGGAKAIHAALARFKEEGRGVLVFLRDGTVGVPLTSIPQDSGTASEEARTRQWREVGLGAQIFERPRDFLDPADRFDKMELCRPRWIWH